MQIRPFGPSDSEKAVALWHECGLIVPWNDPHRDIQRKLGAPGSELFLVAEDDGEIIGTAMGGYDGHRGWINYLACSPRRRRSGIGRAMIEALEAALVARGCAKLNLQVRSSNSEVIAFYQALGYTVDPVTSLGKRLINDPPEGARTD